MLYAVLNENVRRWWFYRDLRAQGKADRARKLERQTMLHIVGILREIKVCSGYMIFTEKSYVIHIKPGRVLTGSSIEMWKEIAELLNIPIINSPELHQHYPPQLMSPEWSAARISAHP